MVDVEATLRRLAHGAHEDCIVHVEHIPPRVGEIRTEPALDRDSAVRLRRLGVEHLWSHQAEALDAVRAGRNVVVATGTASGKSLVYQLAAMEAVRADPRATALFLFPTKALAHDQLRALRDLAVPALRPAAYDGDTSSEDRAWARRTANLIVTNPDMLHAGMLPQHQRWGTFFGNLSVIVIDELHTLRGVFGSHVALVLRRLRRIAEKHGATPHFVSASATIGNPAGHATALTGLPFDAITHDGSPSGGMTFALWNPPRTADPVEGEPAPRYSAQSQASALLAGLARDGVRTIAFTRSRAGAELIAANAREVAGLDASKIASYRAGYLPEERRALERDLSEGSLTALAATNALELGIDIGGLDACILTGFPGSIAAMRQQAGRAGRRREGALAILIAQDDPLDQYLVEHPERLFDHPPEDAVCDPSNPHVLAAHLACAAYELPLTVDDDAIFGPRTAEVRDALVADGTLRKRGARWHHAPGGAPGQRVDLRAAGRAVQIAELGTGRLLGTSDASRAPFGLHPGAIYLHQGERYLVQTLDLDAGVALVVPTDAPYHTQARSVTDLSIAQRYQGAPCGAVTASFGEVDVTTQVVSFSRRRMYSGEMLGEQGLDLPPRTLRTAAVWWEISDDIIATAGLTPTMVPGAAHAAEHAVISLMPLIATCDRWDIGGVSYAIHPETGVCTIFIYDGYPGGAGFAERCFIRAAEHLGATRAAIAACPCVRGCPGCVYSPKCGNGNEPLDKPGAVALLDAMLGARQV